jgi:hypothetical protein
VGRTGSIAHEFKKLVGAFMGDLWFILRHADDPDAVRSRVEEAEAAAIQSGRILDQLLEAVRHPKSEGVRVNQLIADAQPVLRGATGERHRLEMDLAARPDETRGDPGQLQAALLNLVTNARDAMPNDGTVTIATRNVVMRPEMLDERDLTPGRYIMIAVRDTGVGMDGEVLRHAFEPLFTTKESGRGTGLVSPRFAPSREIAVEPPVSRARPAKAPLSAQSGTPPGNLAEAQSEASEQMSSYDIIRSCFGLTLSGYPLHPCAHEIDVLPQGVDQMRVGSRHPKMRRAVLQSREVR